MIILLEKFAESHAKVARRRGRIKADIMDGRSLFGVIFPIHKPLSLASAPEIGKERSGMGRRKKGASVCEAAGGATHTPNMHCFDNNITPFPPQVFRAYNADFAQTSYIYNVRNVFI